MLTTPTKRLLSKILEMDSILKASEEENTTFNEETINSLYEISAEVMSTNKTKTKVSSEDLGAMWDIEDLILFFNTYMSYIEKVTNSKN